MARLRRIGTVLASLALGGVLMAACGNAGAQSQARAACAYVERGLQLDARAHSPGLSAAQRSALETQALSWVLRGTGDAARATSSDGSWNPLMTTINEAEQIPLSDVRASLTALCQQADSATPQL